MDDSYEWTGMYTELRERHRIHIALFNFDPDCQSFTVYGFGNDAATTGNYTNNFGYITGSETVSLTQDARPPNCTAV